MPVPEQLGSFYLGRTVADDGTVSSEPLLYDARDLTTHAVCVGMTGSGKTGLCLSLLEEAALDGVPAIAVDPKGDLGNLLLTFPGLRPDDFRPWIDEGEATRNGQEPDAWAAAVAERWREGLAAWDQDGDRIARLRGTTDLALYTPGSTDGAPLSLLRTLSAPDADVRGDRDGFRERVVSTVSGLLGLLGRDTDPVSSTEHILLSRILEEAWLAGEHVDLPTLIRRVQSPPFRQLGVMELDSVIAPRDRTALAMALNNLLASPTFAPWMEGPPLSAQRLLWTPEGRPRISVLSVAHLSDAERMFFLTLLLNEVVTWVRRQPGTGSLRALLYIDEVFGFLPPVAQPPSKRPLLTLLKQARAFGVGVVLATQNPVDLDYKALSNAGTWFLGRLQTERDKARVMDGLRAAGGAGSGLDPGRLDTLLSGLKSRVFVLQNVHEKGPVLFHTRWALSYLRGPLTRHQLRKLATPADESEAVAEEAGAGVGAEGASAAGEDAPSPRTGPVLPPEAGESHLSPSARPRAGS
ncbi:MAG TPA: hypothetical protein VLL48_01575, partial [Longimicrobiales bacterium]|nr:hypothetical protein [Longimicrobiales bacterium]